MCSKPVPRGGQEEPHPEFRAHEAFCRHLIYASLTNEPLLSFSESDTSPPLVSVAYVH